MNSGGPKCSEKQNAVSGSSEVDGTPPPINRTKTRARKRKRISSDSSTDIEDVLPENTLEVEKNLHISAVKNNLDDASVKKILKKVVTNDHVLALVKLREEEEASGSEDDRMRPKLTRAKAKELMKVSPRSTPWELEIRELRPINQIPVKTRPLTEALIAHDMPEEEDDDDEYQPTNDDAASDDDHTCSDLDSQPRTPATPQSAPASSPVTLRDGPFKVPTGIKSAARRRLEIEEEDATIALRTRSKLSLSSTPIEHIESSFVPPDDLPLPDVDDLWNEFLESCLNPAESSRHEEDDEADPEYSVAADPDAPDEDEEALEKCIVKISKKELNDLVTELFHIMPDTEPAVAASGDVNGSSTLSSNNNNSLFSVNNSSMLSANSSMLSANSSMLSANNSSMLSSKEGWMGKQEPQSDGENGDADVEGVAARRNSTHRQSMSIGKTEPMDEDDSPLVVDDNVVEKNVQLKQKNWSVKNSKKPGKVVVSVEEEEENAVDISTTTKIPRLLSKVGQAGPTHRTEIHSSVKMLPAQLQILQQQLRQHVQLAASNCLQLCIHPIYWSHAATYTGYLESLDKMSSANPSSVVNVCNLRTAVELVRSWEQTVSEDTPENVEMVKFIQNENEAARRRFTHNRLYLGKFHPRVMQVIANSSVFLYPFMLPPIPYRPDPVRRIVYLRSEDELIALGLDQFYEYMEDNPELYHRPRSSHGRWGYTAAATLVCRYLLPWITPRSLMNHVFNVRKADPNNPISKFFESRTVAPVKHKLLPYNPSLTLYQQPEHEMPLQWLRYIAKSSKRAKAFLSRRTTVNGLKPEGLPVDIESTTTPPTKTPLPPDFTKKIYSTRLKSLLKMRAEVTENINIQINVPGADNKTDDSANKHNGSVTIEPKITTSRIVPDIVKKDNCYYTMLEPFTDKTNIDNDVITIKPDQITSLNQNTEAQSKELDNEDVDKPAKRDSLLASQIFSVVKNSEGSFLVPLMLPDNPKAVDTNIDNDMITMTPDQTTLLNQNTNAQSKEPDTEDVDKPAKRDSLLASQIFSVVKNSTGSFLVPLMLPDNPKAVDSNIDNDKITMTADQTTSLNQNTNAQSTEPDTEDVDKPVKRDSLLASQIFSVVKNSTGSFLVPLMLPDNTKTVDSTGIVPTPMIQSVISKYLPVNSEISNSKTGNSKTAKDIDHCKCCVLLRSIVRERQTSIKEYFKPTKSSYKVKCPCSKVEWPKITSRLRLMVNLHKMQFSHVWTLVNEKIAELTNSVNSEKEKNDVNPSDLAFVSRFQLKLAARTSMASYVGLRRRVYSLFNRFNPDLDSARRLAEEIQTLFKKELVDMHKEFLAFLTPRQADELDCFRDYFVVSCAEDFVRKIHAEVSDKETKLKVTHQVKQLLNEKTVTSSCDICCELMSSLVKHPTQAQYLFSLFPHRYKDMNPKPSDSNRTNLPALIPHPYNKPSKALQTTLQSSSPHVSPQSSPTDQPASDNTKDLDNSLVNYEADHSSSCNGESGDETLIEDCFDTSQIKQEDEEMVLDTPDLTISKTEVQTSTRTTNNKQLEDEYSESSNMSHLIMSEDEPIKSEPYPDSEHSDHDCTPEWSRDDDKVILETVKQFLTSDERKNKTALEILEDKHVFQIIALRLNRKSVRQIRDRVEFLLDTVVLIKSLK